MTESTSNQVDVHSSANTSSEHVPATDADRTGISLPTIIGAISRGIPTLVVLGLLAGLAWWGSHHDWKLPKFSEFAGDNPQPEESWCDAHGVPESDCISCNAELMPKGELYGWCKEHGVHECVLHYPETAQLNDIPQLSQEDFDRAAKAIAARPRTKNDSGCKMHLRRIQFPSIEAVNQAGIDIGLVDRGPIIETIKTTGEVVYDPTLVAHLSSRADGTIWRVEKNVGDSVKRGDVLALVDAAEVGRHKSQLLQSLVQHDLDAKVFARLSKLGSDVVAEKRLDEAKSAVAESEVAVQNAIEALSNLGLAVDEGDLLQRPVAEVRTQLRFLGLPASVRDSIKSGKSSANLIPIVSPRDGVIVDRDAVAGEVIKTNSLLFTVADTSRMWLLLSARLEEADRIEMGQKVSFIPDGSQQEVTGNITWLSTEVDSATRTFRVRVDLPNENGRLRNETFGAGEIILREEPDAIIVPNQVVHWEGCCHIAFVRDKDYFKEDSYKVFHTRSVRPGATMGDNTEIIAGLLPGEVVVTKGSGILRAELLKGNLGAG